jgi:hypothetical protein
VFFQGCFLWIWKDLLDKYADGKLAHATRVAEEEKLVLQAEKTKLAAVAAAKEEFFMEYIVTDISQLVTYGINILSSQRQRAGV